MMGWSRSPTPSQVQRLKRRWDSPTGLLGRVPFYESGGEPAGLVHSA